MNAYRIAIRLPLQAPDGFDLAQVVPVFHKWIQGQSLAGHLLIDVADYLHVEDGPGVVLVSHEANIGLDCKCGEYGLTYQRKRPFGTAFPDRVVTTVQSALMAAKLLQSDLPNLRFQSGRLQLRIVDKLNAPNDASAPKRILPELERVFSKIFGHPIRVDHHPDPLKHFEAMVETGSSLDIADALQRASVTSI